MMGGKKFGGIPDRWLDYKKTGNPIDGTQFVAFKVPLKTELTVAQTDDIKFSIEQLVELLPQLGLVVDLTNTTRYYNPEEFDKFNVKYCKIATQGHEIPEKELVRKFFQVAKSFIHDNPEKLVGVHCTHGVNRTGYFICSFMIMEKELTPNEAIDKFAVARGHSIERANYLTALRLLNHKQRIVESIEKEVKVDSKDRKRRDERYIPRNLSPTRRRDSREYRRDRSPYSDRRQSSRLQTDYGRSYQSRQPSFVDRRPRRDYSPRYNSYERPHTNFVGRRDNEDRRRSSRRDDFLQRPRYNDRYPRNGTYSGRDSFY